MPIGKIIPKPSNETTGEPSWRWRRIVALGVIIFCMVEIDILRDNADTGLNGAIAEGLLWLLFAITLIYTGFATAQDITAIITARSGRPYADVVKSVEPAPAADNVTVADTAIVPGGTIVQKDSKDQLKADDAKPDKPAAGFD